MTEISPCYGCPDKNYAAGCARGCGRRDEHIAECEANSLEATAKAAAKAVLTDGARKAIRRRRK